MITTDNDRRIFHWQQRWQGLLDSLERAMQIKLYYVLMCLATVVLILVYVAVVTQAVEPAKWPKSDLVKVRDSELHAFDFKQLERFERSIRNIDRMYRALSVETQWRPTPILLDVAYLQEMGVFASSSSFAMEAHVLRLWMDELRGQPALGVFELAGEAVVRAVLWELFPTSKPLRFEDRFEGTWYEEIQTLVQSCQSQEDVIFGKSTWWQLCRTKSTSEMNRANPVTLAKWLGSRIYRKNKLLGPLERMVALRDLMTRATAAATLQYDRAQAWPVSASGFGANLISLSKLLGIPGIISQQRAFDSFHVMALNQLPDSLVDYGLLVVKSCQFPQVRQLANLQARELVWIQSCDEDEKIHIGRTADEFAAANPHVLMAKLGLEETRMALQRGWLDGSARVTELRSGNGLVRLHPNLLAQREEWRADLQVWKLFAPVQVLQFLRPLKN